VVIWLDVNPHRIAWLAAATKESACSPFALGTIDGVANDGNRCVDFIREVGLAASDGIEARLKRTQGGGELVGGQRDGVCAQDVSDLPIGDCSTKD